MKTLSLLLLSISCVSFADPSVWEQSKADSSLSVQGKIKSVSVDEENKQVIIRIQNESSSAVNSEQTLRMCSEGLGATKEEFFKKAQMDLIRDAMSKGEKVKLSYSSAFNPCISTVTLISGSSTKGS